MNEPEELLRSTLCIINLNLENITSEINTADKKMETTFKQALNLEKKIDEAEKNYFNYGKTLEKNLITNKENIDQNKIEKYKENIKLLQYAYLQSINEYNNNVQQWNDTVNECLAVYKKHSLTTYPILISKLLADFEKMQNLIFKIGVGMNKNFQIAKENIQTLFLVEYNVMPYIFKEKIIKNYTLSSDIILSNPDFRAGFYNKKVHDSILILKKIIPNFMSDYDSSLETYKVYVIDSWKEIMGIEENDFETVEDVIKCKDNIEELLSNEKVVVHFLEYLNLKRGNAASVLETHAFILMGLLFKKMAAIGYDEKTGNLNILILRKLFVMSQTYSCKFKFQKKIYLIRFLENIQSFSSFNFWQSYCSTLIEEEKNNIENPNSEDYIKRTSNVVYSKLIGLIQLMNEFKLSQENINLIVFEIIKKFEVEEKSQNEIKQFISCLSSDEKKNPFRLADLLENLEELIQKFLEIKNRNRGDLFDHNAGNAGSFI